MEHSRTNGDYRIVEIGITAANKGNIEQKFDQIRLKIRGIKKDQELHEIKSHEPRLSFPVVLKVPIRWSQLDARSTFKYFGVNEIHSAERAFKLAENKV